MRQLLNIYIQRTINSSVLKNFIADWTKGKLAYISFDDGWQGNLKLIPIIEKYNVHITIFIAVNPIMSGNFWWEFVAKKVGYTQMQNFKNLPHDEFESQLKKISFKKV